MHDSAAGPVVGEDLYRQVREWLYQEAELLDEGRFEAWLELLADDLLYQAPVRLTRERATGGDVSFEMFHLDETRATLGLRVERLRTERAEKPAKKTAALRSARSETSRSDKDKDKDKEKKVKPIQDEWGFFDPEQCGFAALLAKLDEVTDPEEQQNAPSDPARRSQ